MSRLGAIFAGGEGRRFGGDKAAAHAHGVALIERVAHALDPQCDRLVVVGRDWPGLARVEDRPLPGLGPLGALAGALAYAFEQGFDDVLTSGCDLPDMPGDLAAWLATAPAVIAGQPLIGLWPATSAAAIAGWLEASGDRSMRGWISRSGAAEISYPRAIANINTKDELAKYEAGSPAVSRQWRRRPGDAAAEGAKRSSTGGDVSTEGRSVGGSIDPRACS